MCECSILSRRTVRYQLMAMLSWPDLGPIPLGLLEYIHNDFTMTWRSEQSFFCCGQGTSTPSCFLVSICFSHECSLSFFAQIDRNYTFYYKYKLFFNNDRRYSALIYMKWHWSQLFVFRLGLPNRFEIQACFASGWYNMPNKFLQLSMWWPQMIFNICTQSNQFLLLLQNEQVHQYYAIWPCFTSHDSLPPSKQSPSLSWWKRPTCCKIQLDQRLCQWEILLTRYYPSVEHDQVSVIL